MAYQESDFQSDFTAWLREERTKGNHCYSAAFELKISKTNSLALSKFQPHQIPQLQKAKHECVYKKLSDFDPGFKPFDAFQICGAKAFVVILFYVPRAPKKMIWIDVDEFQNYFLTNNKKSIREEEAVSIGHVYDLK